MVSSARRSVSLPPVAKITVACALHNGLSARELDVRAKTLGKREVGAADQQESKLWLTQLLVELCVAASRDIDLIGILRLRADSVVDGVSLGEGGKRQRHVLPDMLGCFRTPPLFAEATINVAESLTDKGVRAFLTQFRLQRFDEGNQDLCLYLGLLYDRDIHA